MQQANQTNYNRASWVSLNDNSGLLIAEDVHWRLLSLGNGRFR